MTITRRLTITVLWHGVGIAATALTGMVVSRRHGPAGQGYLSYHRAITDFICNLALFGLPQALVVLLNRRAINAHWAFAFATSYGIGFGLLSLAVFLILHSTGWAEHVIIPWYPLSCVLFGSFGFLLHGLYRAISLTSTSITRYNLVSVTPPILALVLYLGLPTASHDALLLVMALSALLGAAVGGLVLATAGGRLDWRNSGTTLKAIVTCGIWSFLPTIFANATTLATYEFLRRRTSSEVLVGQFSISLLFLSTALLPLNMIVPILFDTWSKDPASTNTRVSYVRLAQVGNLLALLSPVVWPAVPWATSTFFGSSFAPSAYCTQLLLIGMVAHYQTRLLSAMLLAVGHPEIVALGSLIKTVSALLFIFFASGYELTAAGLAWTVSEFLSVAVMAVFLSRRMGWRVTELLGLTVTTPKCAHSLHGEAPADSIGQSATHSAGCGCGSDV